MSRRHDQTLTGFGEPRWLAKSNHLGKSPETFGRLDRGCLAHPLRVKRTEERSSEESPALPHGECQTPIGPAWPRRTAAVGLAGG